MTHETGHVKCGQGPGSCGWLGRVSLLVRASNSIFLAPSTEMEVYGLINQIKSHKARRANDIESKFIKLANPVIANFLSEMFNLSLNLLN